MAQAALPVLRQIWCFRYLENKLKTTSFETVCLFSPCIEKKKKKLLILQHLRHCVGQLLCGLFSIEMTTTVIERKRKTATTNQQAPGQAGGIESQEKRMM